MNDLISRKMALRELANQVIGDKIWAVDARRAIENLPSAQAERETGKWIKKKNIMLGDYIECSLCKNVESRIAPGWWNGKKYCPNCGVAMRGDDERTKRLEDCRPLTSS